MKFFARRLLHTIILLFATITFVFFAGRMIGDPALNILGPSASDLALEQLRENMGLNDPLLLQYLRFLKDVGRGDFGVSYRFGFSIMPTDQLRGTGHEVMPIVLERLPATFLLAGVAISIAVILALIMGSLAAMRPRSIADRLVNVASLAGVSIVQFWLGLMLIIFFSVKLGLLPTSGYGSWQHVILPALTLAARPMGRLAQVVRSSMLDELAKPYIIAARAKGVSEMRIVFIHSLKNAAIPIVTLLGSEMSALLTGTILVERVFAWPGIGLLLIDSLSRRDLPLVQAGIFVVAVLVILINFLVDVTYIFLNPRVKLGSTEA